MYPYSRTSRDINSSINVSDDASMLHINSISLGTQPIIPQNWLYRLESHRHTHTHTFLFPIVIETPIIPLSTLSLSLCDIKNDMLDVVHLNPINSLTSCLLPCLHICRWILINKIMQRFNDRVGCSLYVHIGLYIHNNIGLFVLGSAFGDESG